MAKPKKPEKGKGGPYLAAAFFCERTMEEKEDSALSAIRITDQIVITIDPSAPLDVPSETHRLPVPINALLSFKSGAAPGHHLIRLIMHSPSGKSSPVFEQSLPFTEPPYGGANVRLNNTIYVNKGGLFWLDVYLDGKRITRMPLQITIQRGEAAVEAAKPTEPV